MSVCTSLFQKRRTWYPAWFKRRVLRFEVWIRTSPASCASLARVPFAGEGEGYVVVLWNGCARVLRFGFGHPLRAVLRLLASPSRGGGERYVVVLWNGCARVLRFGFGHPLRAVLRLLASPSLGEGEGRVTVSRFGCGRATTRVAPTTVPLHGAKEDGSVVV